MKNIWSLLIFFVVLLTGSCDFEWLATSHVDGIRVRNNSSLTIVVCGKYILPETLLPQEQLETTKIPPNASVWVSDSKY